MITDSDRMALQTRQQLLVTNLFDQHTPTVGGLMIYRNSLLMNSARALSLSYPVMTQLVGEQAMAVLARELLLRHPPHSGDWAEWGGQLSHLIACTQALAEMGFLQEVARLEWVLHQVGRLSPPPTDVTTLQYLEQLPLDQVKVHLSPSIDWISSRYPIDEIWRAHRKTDQDTTLDQESLAAAIAGHHGERHLLIYQQNAVPRIRPLSDLEHQWFIAIENGLSVAELLEHHPEMNFVQWFAEAVSQRWITHLSQTPT